MFLLLLVSAFAARHSHRRRSHHSHSNRRHSHRRSATNAFPEIVNPIDWALSDDMDDPSVEWAYIPRYVGADKDIFGVPFLK